MSKTAPVSHTHAVPTEHNPSGAVDSTPVGFVGDGTDPQAADVGTVGEPTIIGMDLASGPDIAWPPAIPPTVGRKVWFFPNGCAYHSTPHCIDEDTPMDADVVYVWSDRMVNVTVKDHIGQVHAFTSVTMLQPDDEIPVSGGYCTWVPYQIGQAKAAA